MELNTFSDNESNNPRARLRFLRRFSESVDFESAPLRHELSWAIPAPASWCVSRALLSGWELGGFSPPEWPTFTVTLQTIKPPLATARAEHVRWTAARLQSRTGCTSTRQSGRRALHPTSVSHSRLGQLAIWAAHAPAPGMQDVDASLLKNWVLSHERRIQFRVEAFNLLNRPAFQVPRRNLRRQRQCDPTPASSRRNTNARAADTACLKLNW